MFERNFYLFCDKVIKVIRVITGVSILLMLLVVVFQVFARGIFDIPTPWTEEVTTILITYNTFIGGIALMIRGEHLAIDLVSEHISPKMRNFFQILYLFVIMGVCTYLTIFGTQLCIHPMIYKQTTIAIGFPRVLVYGVMPICMAFCDIYCLFHLFFIFRHLTRSEVVMSVHTVNSGN